MSYTGNLGFLFYRLYFSDYDYNKGTLSFNNITQKNEDIINFENKDTFDLFISGKHCFKLKTTYPGLLIGSGYTHDLSEDEAFKIGFYFDHTTGLPIIPGSSVKGVLRSVFPGELKKDKNPYRTQKAEYLKEYLENLGIKLQQEGAELINLLNKVEYEIFEGASEVEFDKDKIKVKKYKPMNERDIFFDGFITETQTDKKIFSDDTINPHGNDPLKNPTPIKFLKILPEIEFQFNFDLKGSKIIKNLTADKKTELFKNILLDRGLGAKTNVGYGQFEPVTNSFTKIKITQELAKELKKNKTFQCKVTDIVDDYYYFEFKDYSNTKIRKKKQNVQNKLSKKGIGHLEIGNIVEIKINNDYQYDNNPNFTVIKLIQ